MSVNTTLSGLSQTAASNGPDGSVDPPSTVDDSVRYALSFIASLRDGKGFTSPVVLASAGTTDIGAQNAQGVEISGTTTITSFGTTYNGPRFLRFTGALTLTHNSSTLILPTGANIVTAAGDTCVAMPKTTAGTADGWVVLAYQRASGASLTTSKSNDFRLTLTSGTPITTSDVTGATTIYAAPTRTGNSIALFDGVSTWNTRTSAQFSVALGTLTSGLPYDLFVYDNAGTPTFRSPVAWTNTTTRATALTTQDGVLVKTGATTDRYVGTFYTTSTTTTEDSEANRYLFNYYNQVDRIQSVVDTTDSWAYSTASWRQARGSATNQFNNVIGIADTLVEIDVHGSFVNAGGAGSVAVGVGIDSTTVNSAKTFGGIQVLSNAGCNLDAKYRGYPAIGFHTYAWLEVGIGGGAGTFYGDNGTAFQQSGMMGKFKA